MILEETRLMKKGILYTLLAALLFSSMEIAIKLTGTTYHPLQLNFLRFLLGGIMLLPLAHRQNRQLPLCLPWRAYLFYALSGFVFVVVSMTIFVLSLRIASASTVAILFSCNAFFSIALAAVFLHQPVSRPTMMALFLCFIGLVFIINPFHLKDSAFGMALALFCAFSFSVYSNMVKYSLEIIPYDGLIPTAYSLIFGALELGLLIALTHVDAVAQGLVAVGLENFAAIPLLKGLSIADLPLFLYIAIGVSGIGFAAYSYAVELASMTIASVTFFLKPVLAPIMAFLILGERQPGLALMGILVLSVGALLVVLENLGVIGKVPRPERIKVQKRHHLLH